MNPARTKSTLGNFKSPSLSTNKVADRNTDIIKLNLKMTVWIVCGTNESTVN